MSGPAASSGSAVPMFPSLAPTGGVAESKPSSASAAAASVFAGASSTRSGRSKKSRSSRAVEMTDGAAAPAIAAAGKRASRKRKEKPADKENAITKAIQVAFPSTKDQIIGAFKLVLMGAGATGLAFAIHFYNRHVECPVPASPFPGNCTCVDLGIPANSTVPSFELLAVGGKELVNGTCALVTAAAKLVFGA